MLIDLFEKLKNNDEAAVSELLGLTSTGNMAQFASYFIDNGGIPLLEKFFYVDNDNTLVCCASLMY